MAARMRHGSADRPAAATFLALLALAMLVAACGTERETALVTFPPATLGAGIVTAASDVTRKAIDRSLSGIGLSAGLPQIPYRPGEAPLVAAAPRTVLEVAIPGGSGPAYVSIYEFANVDSATAAGAEQARYVASPVGRVLFTTGTQFAVRQSGTTVVFYSWLPSADDPRTDEIASALESVGTVIEVPR